MTGRWTAAGAAGLLIAAGFAGAAAPIASAQAAAPEQSARAVEVITGGSRIGVSIRNLEDAELKSLAGVTSGVVIQDVSADGPAAKAGMRTGDIIVEFDGERVRSARQLTRLVRETAAGHSVPVTVVRDGKRTSVTVTPAERGNAFGGFDFDDLGDLRDLRLRALPRVPRAPSVPTPPSPWRFDELRGRATRLGIRVESLSSQLADYFGTKSGVLVSSVTDNSPAARAGVRAGDVVTSLNGSPIGDPADLRRRLQELRDGDDFTLEVMRDRKPVTLKGKIERDDRGRGPRTII